MCDGDSTALGRVVTCFFYVWVAKVAKNACQLAGRLTGLIRRDFIRNNTNRCQKDAIAQRHPGCSRIVASFELV